MTNVATHARVTALCTRKDGSTFTVEHSWTPVSFLAYAIHGALMPNDYLASTVVTGITLGETGEGYLVTDCRKHGTKETGDSESAIHYQNLAREWMESGHFDGWMNEETGHYISSWACCEVMRVAYENERVIVPL